MLWMKCSLVNKAKEIKIVKLNNSDYKAYILEKENWNKTIYYNWWESEEYKNISIENLFLTKKWTIIFVAQKNNWKYVLIKDDKEIINYEDNEFWWNYKSNYCADYKYNIDWDKLIYSYKNEDNLCNVIYDWKKVWEGYKYVWNLKISNNWTSYAFQWNSFVIKDWIKSEEYEEMRYLTYSKDWKHFSYLITNNQKMFIVLDWKELEKYSNISYFIFWNNSSNLIYSIQNNNKIVLLKNWENIWEYNNIKYIWDIFMKKNNILFTAKKTNWKDILVKNWKILLEADTIFTHDNSEWGDNYYFTVKDEWKRFIIINDKKIIIDKKYYLWWFIYWKDEYVYKLEEKESWKMSLYWINWKKSKNYDLIWNIIFSKNDDLFYYAFDWKNTYIVKNWKEFKLNFSYNSLQKNNSNWINLYKNINNKKYLYSCN